MNARINIENLEPEAYQAMFGLEKYLSNSTVAPPIFELIKIRASQLNGCAFCMEMHTQGALKLGMSASKLFAIAVWKESSLFTEQERAVLAITDEVTLIHQRGVTDVTYQGVSAHFTGPEIAQIIMRIATINVWNRMGVATPLEQ